MLQRAMMRMTSFGFFVTITFFGGATGCGDCQSFVCSDYLNVQISEGIEGPLTDGEYVIGVETELNSYSGTCEVRNDGREAACETEGDFVVRTPKSSAEDSRHKTFAIDFPFVGEGGSVPKQLKVKVEHDGTIVVDGSWEPEYVEEDPECHPMCIGGLLQIPMTRS